MEKICLEAKAKFDCDKELVLNLAKHRKKRLNKVSYLLSGESPNSSNTVANGPQFCPVTESQVMPEFLCINNICGSDFSSRYFNLAATMQEKKSFSKLIKIKQFGI